MECLHYLSAERKLSEKCEKELLGVQKQEMTDNSVDYALMTMCDDTIAHFCPQYEREHVLDCLKVGSHLVNQCD